MTAPDKTYWDIVKTQFGKHRTAVWALYVFLGLFLLAIGAPLVATSSPFAIRQGGTWSFPWFADLFDQTIWQSGVDLLFNLMLLFLVPTALLCFLLPRHRKPVLGLVGAVFLWAFFSMVGPASIVKSRTGRLVFLPQHVLRYSTAKVDYNQTVRAPRLQLVLAEQKLASYARKLEEKEGGLAAAEQQLAAAAEQAERVKAGRDTPPGADRPGSEPEAEAERTAAARDAVYAQLNRDMIAEQAAALRGQVERWTEKLEAARRRVAADDTIIVMPPVGYHHADNDLDRIVEAPTWSGWGVGHFLGTDKNGRDVFARLLYGARISLTIGVIAVSLYCTIGTVLGAIMGFFGGKTDMFLMRVVEIMMCFPVLAFILIVVSVFGRSIFVVMVAIGVIGWSGVARLIRGQFLSERNLDYVVAARALGIPTHRIVFRHVLPNAIHPVFVAATFGVAAAILMESGLAFLGLGDPNVPSWGQILLQGRETMANWLIFGPGVAIFLTVTVLNLVGEGLRDALDPKLRQ